MSRCQCSKYYNLIKTNINLYIYPFKFLSRDTMNTWYKIAF